MEKLAKGTADGLNFYQVLTSVFAIFVSLSNGDCEPSMDVLLDQSNYLEEINKHLK